MNGKQSIYSALTSAQNNAKTGRLFIYGSARPNVRSFRRPAEIDILDGEIIAMRHLECKGRAALQRIMSLQITDVMFLDSNTMVGNVEADTPTLIEVLQYSILNDEEQKTKTDQSLAQSTTSAQAAA